ncbi:hypothetical protein ETI11_05435 [Macrococcoides canis]|uniref:Novel STAND NTPase 3 domain-containing protein n=1 Tax=Macrococcoides canis TaxID=1855823 RepID=A0A4R6C5H5_9STAP|nr:hypothetical protein [Macrococcus canis]TDM16845.1 hypothetical protein ETI04_06500 [Macrococcus canis]TDM37113.1 hypothetical protein ETI11_05435 [Macrococcus canis]
MSRLNRIQTEIKQLDGGRFQKLCDSYLYRKRKWVNIVSLGSMEGADKTTKGIPDTYYFDKQTNKYILVMYGTRADVLAKLEVDIREAIEKTKIEDKDIQEIICCHTSSNISVARDKELRELAGSIDLTLIGIDTLSHDLLHFKYQDIAKDFLGIAESTEQVWNIEQFISIHDKSRTNAPLNTYYIDEAHTVGELIEELNYHQILLLSGVSGVGKTRLAIEICKSLSSDNNVICVKSNNMSAYQDIKDALDDNRINYLLLDDANTITNFKAIVNLLSLEEFVQNLKIIITVRDYALSEVVTHLESFKTKLYKVPLMSDEKIESLINSINEFSPTDIRKIMKLSHNNPRLAVIASIMIKDNNYEFIDNEKDILGCYYSQIIKENLLSQNEKISLFILSFKRKLNLTNKEALKKLLKFFKIDINDFNASLKKLHDKELCDIFHDKATKVSDQSLSDFVIIDFIVDKKVFKVRDFFISLFPENAKEIVEMLVLVNNFKSTNEWKDYLKTEIKYVYNEVIADVDKERFLIQYGVLIPIEALVYCKEKIQSTNCSEYQISQKEFEEKKRTNSVNDPIIDILCTLSNSERFYDAGTLLIEYLKRRQDKVYEVYSAVKLNFDIEDGWHSYLEKRFNILEIFSKQENINMTIALLIANIAEEFLKFSSDKIVSEGNRVLINHYTLIDGDYLIRLHRQIYELLSRVYELKYEQVNNYIDKLLFNYPVYEVRNGFFKTVSSDLYYIENLFFKDLSKLSIRDEAIVYKLSSKSNKLGLESNHFTEYEPSKKQIIYNVFSSDYLIYKKEEFNYEESQILRAKKLKEIFNEYSFDLLQLFNVLSEYQSDELLNKHQIEESVSVLYSILVIEEKKKMLISILNSSFTFTYPNYEKYMGILPFNEGANVLKSVEKELDERWYLSNLLTCQEVNRDMVQELITFLKKLKNYEIINTFSILSFKNYIEKDRIIFDVLIDRYKEGKILGRFFIPIYATEENAINIINMLDYKELKEIYLDIIVREDVDNLGEFFKSLLKDKDINFIYVFLVKLNTSRLNLNFVKRDIQLKYIWESEIAEAGIRKYLDFLIGENRLIYVGVDPYLEGIFTSNLDRARKFIKSEVRDTEDMKKLVSLYNLSFEVFDDKFLLELFELLKEKEIDAHTFEKIYLTRGSRSWSGSLVPLLDKDISFLNKLLEIFDGVKYISHALVISSRIDALNKQKEKELLSDYLD